MHIQGSFAFNSLSTRPSHPSPSRGFPTGGLALANVNRRAEWRSCAQRLNGPAGSAQANRRSVGIGGTSILNEVGAPCATTRVNQPALTEKNTDCDH